MKVRTSVAFLNSSEPGWLPQSILAGTWEPTVSVAAAMLDGAIGIRVMETNTHAHQTADRPQNGLDNNETRQTGTVRWQY